MATLSSTTAPNPAVVSSSRTTIVTNLFQVPTGACSLAISIANVVTERGGGPSGEATSTVVSAQPVSNPDIAGIGILIAFLSTAYGIFLWMLVAYCCRLLPSSLLGQVDEFIFKRPARKTDCPPWWQNAVNHSILAYADLQIATGVAILTAAFSTMSTLSVYHYQVAIYLAWISSNTHLTAVSLLQTEFRENKNRSITRRLRLAAMAFLGVMLLVALVPTASYSWLAIITRNQQDGHAYTVFHKTTLSSASVPARCFWQRQYSSGLAPDAAWSFIILVLSYFWKGLQLFQPSQRLFKETWRGKLQEPLRKRLDRVAALLELNRPDHRLSLILHYKLALCLYVAVWGVFELAQSFVITLWICGAGLVWGTLQILVPRYTLPSQTLDTESVWTFGQVLSITLLAVPIFSFTEGYVIQKAESAHKHRSDELSGSDDSVDPHPDEQPIITRTTIVYSTTPQASQNKLPPLKTDSSPNPDQTSEGNDNQSRATKVDPPWRCDNRIYKSRYIRSAFYCSQLGILALGVIFILFYFQLSLPIDNSNHSKLQATLATDYGIWFLVGCTILGWVGMAVLLLLGGAIFSNLFKIER